MPDNTILKPKFQYVQGKSKRDDENMKSDEDAESGVSEAQMQINNEVDMIMKALSQKGDIIEELKQLLDDKTQITTSGMQLKQIFLEIIFTKYGA